MKWVVACLIALSCCSPKVPVKWVDQPVVAAMTLRGDLDFTMPERIAVEKATRVLAGATGGAVQIRIVWDLDWHELTGHETHVILRVDADSPWVMAADAESEGLMLGYAPHGRQTVFLVADRIAKLGYDLTTIAAHEFGHVLGLPHIDVPKSLMRPGYRGPVCPSRVDLAALCQLHGCDVARTNPC